MEGFVRSHQASQKSYANAIRDAFNNAWLQIHFEFRLIHTWWRFLSARNSEPCAQLPSGCGCVCWMYNRCGRRTVMSICLSARAFPQWELSLFVCVVVCQFFLICPSPANSVVHFALLSHPHCSPSPPLPLLHHLPFAVWISCTAQFNLLH